MKRAYRHVNFRADTLAVIEYVNKILDEYEAQGFESLTLRQVYYQLVARDMIPNRVREYDRLGSIINKARLAGLIDWLSITDRTRNLRSLAHWSDPSEILEASAKQYRIDKWARQEYRPEVWIEKDALIGVIAGVCDELDVPYFSCRGYTSQSEMWLAAQRLHGYLREGQTPLILHFGDHDPSGIDMTRDIRDRLEMFMGGTDVERLALNFVQVEEFSPPPNPAKETDSRFEGYRSEYGDESWELDALNPTVLASLIRDSVELYRDDDLWEEAEQEETEARARLSETAAKWHNGNS